MFLTLSSLMTYSQNDSKINAFIEKINQELKGVDSTARLVEYKESISKRKISINGWIGKKYTSYKQSIKYYRGGMKKDILKIYIVNASEKFVAITIIRINDKIHLIEFYNTARDKFNNPIKLSKEVLIDNKVYQKTILSTSISQDKPENEVIFLLSK